MLGAGEWCPNYPIQVIVERSLVSVDSPRRLELMGSGLLKSLVVSARALT